MRKGISIIAAAAAGLAVLTVLSSVLLLAGHAGHDCAGEDCPVCAQLAACVRRFGTAAAAAAAAVAAAAVLCHESGGAALAPAHAAGTLVLWKVKLSD